MTSRDFCYWLQGFFEINECRVADCREPNQSLGGAQVDTIKRHLEMVFKHEIDPSFGSLNHQSELNTIHHGPFQPVVSDSNKLRPRC